MSSMCNYISAIMDTIDFLSLTYMYMYVCIGTYVNYIAAWHCYMHNSGSDEIVIIRTYSRSHVCSFLINTLLVALMIVH